MQIRQSIVNGIEKYNLALKRNMEAIDNNKHTSNINSLRKPEVVFCDFVKIFLSLIIQQ